MIDLQFQYRFLFKVDFENNYFRDKKLRRSRFVPTPQTEALLNQFNLLFRITDDGFGILADNMRGETMAIQLENPQLVNRSFDFLFYMDEPLFKNYTQLPFDTSKQIFCFTNSTKGAESNVCLHESDYVTASELKSIEEIEFEGPLAKAKGIPMGLVRIVLTKEIIEKSIYHLMDNDMPGFHYSVKFDSRESYWKYLVVPAYVKKLTGLKIVVQDSENIKFKGGEKILLDNRAEAIVFQSEIPVKLKEIYDFNFQLKRSGGEGNGGKTIIKKMQFPGVSSIRAIDRDDDSKCCSEVYVYI